jgi:hypothetical protein
MIEPAQIAQIEAVERDAWLDIYAAAPSPIRSALGIVQRRVDDGALLTAAPSITCNSTGSAISASRRRRGSRRSIRRSLISMRPA